MDTLGIGLIGGGRAGLVHARNFSTSVPQARMRALSDASAENLAAAARELGIEHTFSEYRNLLARDDIHAVVSATPTSLHREIAVAAAEAGKHILCEKPLAMNAEEGEAMIQAAEAARVKLQIGFMRRFDPEFVEAKNRLDAGEIGELVSIRSITHGPSLPRPWMFDLKRSNGPLAEVNSHDLDTLRWFAGREVTRVYALGGNFRSPEARKEYPDFYDNVTLTALFENGCQGSVSGAQGVRYAYDARVEILGTHGLIMIGRNRLDELTVLKANGESIQRGVNGWANLFADGYLAEDRDFIRCILEDDTPRATGKDGREVVRLVEAGNRSIRTGDWIDIPHDS